MKKEERIPYGDRIEDGTGKEQLPFFATRRGQSISVLILVVIVAVLIVLQLNSGGSVACGMDDTYLAVACLDRETEFIALDSISKVELVDTFRMDQTIDSAAWDAGWCGIYRNEEFGQFTLFAYSSTGKYVVVHHKDGVLVFNQKSGKQTRTVYEKLLKKTGLSEN